MQPRIVAFILGLLISISTASFCSLIPGTPASTVAVTSIVAFTSSFLLIYFTIEYLIFKELSKIQSQFQKLKKKEFNLKTGVIQTTFNPLKKLNEDIALFAAFKQREIDDLKKIETYRQEFIADLSHELKTPVFAAQGFIHTLLDGAMEEPDVAKRFLKKAAKSLDGLEGLIQDLLTLSEMETGSVRMKKDSFDILPLVQDVFDQLDKKANKRNIKLYISAPENTDYLVFADQKRIFQVLTNLVENGIKYGHTDGEVRVSLLATPDQIQVSVKDNGPGIPEEDQKRIFDRFYRVEKSRSKDKGGSGLGLAISRRIIEAHKSKIQLVSKPGKGSDFRFVLPIST